MIWLKTPLGLNRCYTCAQVSMHSDCDQVYWQRTTVITDGAKAQQNIQSWFLTIKGCAETAQPREPNIP
jgi:hypothetical protein